MIHTLYSTLGWHDQDMFAAVLIWLLLLTITLALKIAVDIWREL